MLIPHKPTTMVGGIPRILVQPGALEDMWTLIDLHTQEISWLGSVTKQGRDFIIHRVFLIEQFCHSAETEMTTEGIAKLAGEIMAAPALGVDEVNALRFWGHSHVNMGVNPSVSDDKTMDDYFKDDCDWFIRAIGNKKGEMKFDLFWYQTGLTITDMPWSIFRENSTGRTDYWKAQIAEKVKQRTYTNTGHGAYNYTDPPEEFKGWEISRFCQYRKETVTHYWHALSKTYKTWKPHDQQGTYDYESSRRSLPGPGSTETPQLEGAKQTVIEIPGPPVIERTHYLERRTLKVNEALRKRGFTELPTDGCEVQKEGYHSWFFAGMDREPLSTGMVKVNSLTYYCEDCGDPHLAKPVAVADQSGDDTQEIVLTDLEQPTMREE